MLELDYVFKQPRERERENLLCCCVRKRAVMDATSSKIYNINKSPRLYVTIASPQIMEVLP